MALGKDSEPSQMGVKMRGISFVAGSCHCPLCMGCWSGANLQASEEREGLGPGWLPEGELMP